MHKIAPFSVGVLLRRRHHTFQLYLFRYGSSLYFILCYPYYFSYFSQKCIISSLFTSASKTPFYLDMAPPYTLYYELPITPPKYPYYRPLFFITSTKSTTHTLFFFIISIYITSYLFTTFFH